MGPAASELRYPGLFLYLATLPQTPQKMPPPLRTHPAQRLAEVHVTALACMFKVKRAPWQPPVSAASNPSIFCGTYGDRENYALAMRVYRKVRCVVDR